MTHVRVPLLLRQSLCVAALLASLVVATSAAQAYEVWITDQSDTGKESGGFLHIYDGAKLAANPVSAKPLQTIDLSGEINKFCEDATKKAVRRPHMLFFKCHSFLLERSRTFHGCGDQEAGSLFVDGEECARRLADA
ncbi:MAG: hypothetical protein HP490_16195 [Nitrospira sp.]|nr:hypothetical protein [Nitrospira sp.]